MGSHANIRASAFQIIFAFGTHNYSVCQCLQHWDTIEYDNLNTLQTVACDNAQYLLRSIRVNIMHIDCKAEAQGCREDGFLGVRNKED